MPRKHAWLHIWFDLEQQVIALYRCSRWCLLKVPRAGGFLAKVIRHFMRVYSGCDISPKAVIASGLRLPHPLGIIIGDGVEIGADAKIWHRVTIGSHGKKGLPWQYPRIAANVRIYNSASIIGNVAIGEGAVIGAHSLVLRDVPAGATAVGAPARILSSEEKS